VLPGVATVPALLLVAVLLAESFGREAWWLWRSDRVGSLEVAPSAVGSVRA
jgi:hypothetical protein